jgi:hypothetical protein
MGIGADPPTEMLKRDAQNSVAASDRGLIFGLATEVAPPELP